MRGSKHSEALRAQVVAALLSGQGVNATARRFRLHPSIVSRLKRDLAAGMLQQAATDSRSAVEALLLDSLHENLTALAQMAAQVSDPAYLAKQSAKGIAALYGALSAHSERMVEIYLALQRSREERK